MGALYEHKAGDVVGDSEFDGMAEFVDGDGDDVVLSTDWDLALEYPQSVPKNLTSL
jgi:hypothetical protein